MNANGSGSTSRSPSVAAAAAGDRSLWVCCFSPYLEFIVSEIKCPFRDRRQPFCPLSDLEVFYLASGETPEELHEGTAVGCQVAHAVGCRVYAHLKPSGIKVSFADLRELRGLMAARNKAKSPEEEDLSPLIGDTKTRSRGALGAPRPHKETGPRGSLLLSLLLLRYKSKGERIGRDRDSKGDTGTDPNGFYLYWTHYMLSLNACLLLSLRRGPAGSRAADFL